MENNGITGIEKFPFILPGKTKKNWAVEMDKLICGRNFVELEIY